MSARVAQRELDQLVLQLKGLVHVRALLESHGASNGELHEHSEEIDRVRAQLARVAKDSNGGANGAARGRDSLDDVRGAVSWEEGRR